MTRSSTRVRKIRFYVESFTIWFAFINFTASFQKKEYNRDLCEKGTGELILEHNKKASKGHDEMKVGIIYDCISTGKSANGESAESLQEHSCNGGEVGGK